MAENKKIFFISDHHFGVPNHQASLEREKKMLDWIKSYRHEMEELYILGDLFDFWFEYKYVVPKGYVRILGKLAELKDEGLPIYFFTGNHDLWMFGYFEEELGIPVIREPIKKDIKGKTFVIGHGDGIGPGDNGFKMLKKIFTNRFCQWAFAKVHPDLAFAIANFWSRRKKSIDKPQLERVLEESKEWQVIYCKERLKNEKVDFFIFGHRHQPYLYDISESSVFVNIGDWVNYFSYAVFDGNEVTLEYYN